MRPPILLRTVDWYTAEWDYIPPAGETYVIHRFDTQERFLKIGDGKRRLGDLPNISTSIFGEEEMPRENLTNETCSDCEHLCILNRNKVYAVCDELGKVFELWKMDTRATDACAKFIKKGD